MSSLSKNGGAWSWCCSAISGFTQLMIIMMMMMMVVVTMLIILQDLFPHCVKSVLGLVSNSVVISSNPWSVTTSQA